MTLSYSDIAWTYDFPTRQLLPIAGLIAFYNEKVDTFLDGRLLGWLCLPAVPIAGNDDGSDVLLYGDLSVLKRTSRSDGIPRRLRTRGPIQRGANSEGTCLERVSGRHATEHTVLALQHRFPGGK